jgi:hypothetical protein
MSRNENGDVAYQIESPNLEFFSKFVGGKEYGPKGSQTLAEDDVKVFSILDRMWVESPELAIKNIFQKGDCRGGAKEKRLFRVGMNWLIRNHLQWANLEHVPEYRYWKDLVSLAALNSSVHSTVVKMFATQLRKDIQLLHENTPGVSLCAKWVPTEGCAEDRRDPAFLQELRAEMKMNPRKFRKELITPLRAHLKVVERFMCANEWGQINYSQVPSVAMQQYRDSFKKHDQERFDEWVAKLSRGDKSVKVNVSQLFPHTVTQPYLKGGAKDELIEAQFKALVEEVRKMGTFDRALVISDTSGSMSGTPMDVSISLGILISRCLAAPFTDFMINFSEQPAFSKLSGHDLHADVQTLSGLPWGGSTNLDAVFDQLLRKADELKLPAEQMPTRVYILTDMQFNQVSGNAFGALDRARQKFQSRGYEVPEIVCWNLRGDTSTSAMPDRQQGTCTITGFSTAVLKAVMRGRIPDPHTVMVEALTCERYERLAFPGMTAKSLVDALVSDTAAVSAAVAVSHE